MAEDYDVDLVEVAPNAQPPVCRLMDYGKFRYQEQKKAQEMKARQKVIQVKEVKFRPATDENDYQTKLRALRRFLADGDKAKVTLRYRGREMAHQDLGPSRSTLSPSSSTSPTSRRPICWNSGSE